MAGLTTQVGDFIEDTYTSFDGHIVAVTRGVVTEIKEDKPAAPAMDPGMGGMM